MLERMSSPRTLGKTVESMTEYRGIGVYEAVAIGRIALFSHRPPKVEEGHAEDAKAELSRLDQASRALCAGLEELYERALSQAGAESAEIFEIHKMMVEDEEFQTAIADRITQDRVRAEYAVQITGEEFARRFAEMEDAYLQARSADLMQITHGLIDCLVHRKPAEMSLALSSADEGIILCADDLSPAETVLLDKDRVLAMVTARGSAFSHTAILARNMGIPAIVGVGDDFLQSAKEGELAIVDGERGRVFLAPDEAALQEARDRQQEGVLHRESLNALRGLESATLDGKSIHIYANIGSLGEMDALHQGDAEGIGLFRSEFLYLERDRYPTEEEQFAVYRSVLREMNGRMVIIRTMDIGADKQAEYLGIPEEENPALGLRAIRLCLTRPDVFKTQLRALFRASVYGRLGIMFPMITDRWELQDALSLCEAVKGELSREGIAYSADIQLGVMIETPAAALISHRLAPMVDFFSIGTNDLTQYTLACDRQNHSLARFCDPHHEAILRLIAMTVENAHASGAWVGICGELAADLTLTETFLRMGIDELSVSPGYVLKVRKKVRELDLSK